MRVNASSPSSSAFHCNLPTSFFPFILGKCYQCIGSFSGYHDKQGELLNRVLNALVNFKVSEDRFEIFKESYEQSLKNYRRSQPYSHAEYFNYVALSDKL